MDGVVLAYVALLTAVVVADGWRSPFAGWLLLAAGLTTALVALLASAPLGTIGRVLGEVYPFLLLLGLYGAIDLVHMGAGATLRDELVQGWEATLFGGQPARDWWRSHPSGAWSAVFHAAYLSYYIIVPAVPLYCLVTRRWRGLRRATLVIITVFVAYYACYLLFPVAGPYYRFPRPSGAFLGNAPADWTYAILAGGSSYGAAFPSSHVAATVGAVVSAGRESRLLMALLAVPTVLLAVGAVYVQMHYAVDVLAGTAMALVIVGLAGGVERQRPSGAMRAGGA